MVVPTDVQVAFAVGACFADAGAKIIEAAQSHSKARLSALYCRYRLRAFIYAAVFVGPAATTFMLGWPAWETQYWSSAFDSTAGNPVNGGFFAIFLLLLFAGAWLGNWLGFKWVLSGARKRLRFLYTTVLLLTCGLVFARWPAPIRLGTHSAFQKDPTALPYVWQDSTFFVAFWVLSAYCAVPILVWFVQVRKDVNTMRRR